MKAIFLFDIKAYTKGLTSCLLIACLVGAGLFAGSQFNMAAGASISFKSAYSIGFMLGFLSLSIILTATVFAQQLLFKEWDTRFDGILFTTPVSKYMVAGGRFLSLWILTLAGFLLLTLGFGIGQVIRAGEPIPVISYIYPFIFFAGVNSLFVCSWLCCLAWSTRSKLTMAIGGLLLYVLYMVLLLFSNSPLMAQTSPQSLTVQALSAILDPFGLSAWFYDSRLLSVSQHNTVLIPATGYFLLNRGLVIVSSLICLLIGYNRFSRSAGRRKLATIAASGNLPIAVNVTVVARYNLRTRLQSIGAFIKMDMRHLIKSISFPVSLLLLIFYISMELYAAIDKGIRLPQQYAGSGLIATTIIGNFHFIGMLLMIYFVTEGYWKSNTVRISPIENSTAQATSKLWGHVGSSVILLFSYTIILILLGLIFQWVYQYPVVDWRAYAGVLVFNTWPLLLLTAALLLINQLMNRHYLALSTNILMALALASPLSKKVILHPLFRFFSGFNGVYSDFNGYGAYLPAFVARLVFGTAVIGILWLLYDMVKRRKLKGLLLLEVMMLAVVGFFSGKAFMEGYRKTDDASKLAAAVQYEQAYRKYQEMEQPVITEVVTQVNLYPRERAWMITGKYRIRNISRSAIYKILINFDDELNLMNARYAAANEVISIRQPVSELLLQHPLQPADSADIYFEMSYKWTPVNGHQPANAILENGSFMRISRYFPQIGYQAAREITDTLQRREAGLGVATGVVPVDHPKTAPYNFIHLDLVISTDATQTAIGTGELVQRWSQHGRNYFHYRTSNPCPFRFAVSSACYTMRRAIYKGIALYVYYHPTHPENVAHLMSVAEQTLDYCQENFGPYPFHSLTFSEVSAFSSAFAGTAYPASIFMTESSLFHANIKGDQQQDVINELAAHEVSHIWWGNSQIDPDNREGAAMLTETLAMYTEMMLYKKMYGREKMWEKVKIHQQIYDSEKGLSENRPLYKVREEQTHITYSKGAVVMVQLSELIGEHKVNEALRNFLQHHRYPGPRPVSTDLVNEVLQVSEAQHHAEIRQLFMEE